MIQNELKISIEGLSDELLALYRDSGMDRGRAGREAVEWAFARNDAPFCVARQGDEIVGLSAYIRSEMQFGNARGSGFQAVDSFVSPKMRGKGLFTSLASAYAEHVRKTAADLVWGFPNDNAAPAWFGKLEWVRHGQVPFMIRPLRAGYFLRKLKIPGDFPIGSGRDQNLSPLTELGDWVNPLWARFSDNIGCATIRDEAFLRHRIFMGPNAERYRVVADTSENGALVATCEAKKHGGHIAYLMEAFGGQELTGVLHSELARLRTRGAELALAWCYPWSPNYQQLRACGFMPLPEFLRPIRIWFGARGCSTLGSKAENRSNWYLSYLDSDTV